MSAPVEMVWNGSALVPISPFWQRRASKLFDQGVVYHIIDQPERSQRSHGHYFAVLHEAWANLPEGLSDRFPTVEHLRKYALIRAGFFDSHSVTCDTEDDAERLQAFMEPVDEFAVIDRKGRVVTRYTAKSQSYRAMGKEDFAKSKEAVLGILSEIVGVTPDQLKQETGRAA